MASVKPSTGAVVAGAALGAIAASGFMYLAAALAGFTMGDTVRFLGGLLGFPASRAAAAGGIVLAAMALVWAFLYRWLRETFPTSPFGHGALFGLAVWLLSTGILWPLLAQLRPPSEGPGFFALAFGAEPALASILAHVLFGAVLSRTIPAPS